MDKYLLVSAYCALFAATLLRDIYGTEDVTRTDIPGCPSAPVDIVLALDVSNSIWLNDFQREIAFSKRVLETFSSSLYDAQFAVVSFGMSADINGYFNRNKDNSLRKLLDSIHQPGGSDGSSTNILHALQLIQTKVLQVEHGARSKVLRLLFVFTDGRYDQVKEVYHTAKNIRESGVYIAAFGCGQPNLAQLYGLISQPKHKLLFGSIGYTNLSSLEHLVRHNACKMMLTTNASSYISEEPVDTDKQPGKLQNGHQHHSPEIKERPGSNTPTIATELASKSLHSASRYNDNILEFSETEKIPNSRKVTKYRKTSKHTTNVPHSSFTIHSGENMPSSNLEPYLVSQTQPMYPFTEPSKVTKKQTSYLSKKSTSESHEDLVIPQTAHILFKKKSYPQTNSLKISQTKELWKTKPTTFKETDVFTHNQRTTSRQQLIQTVNNTEFISQKPATSYIQYVNKDKTTPPTYLGGKTNKNKMILMHTRRQPTMSFTRRVSLVSPRFSRKVSGRMTSTTGNNNHKIGKGISAKPYETNTLFPVISHTPKSYATLPMPNLKTGVTNNVIVPAWSKTVSIVTRENKPSTLLDNTPLKKKQTNMFVTFFSTHKPSNKLSVNISKFSKPVTKTPLVNTDKENKNLHKQFDHSKESDSIIPTLVPYQWNQTPTIPHPERELRRRSPSWHYPNVIDKASTSVHKHSEIPTSKSDFYFNNNEVEIATARGTRDMYVTNVPPLISQGGSSINFDKKRHSLLWTKRLISSSLPKTSMTDLYKNIIDQLSFTDSPLRHTSDIKKSRHYKNSKKKPTTVADKYFAKDRETRGDGSRIVTRAYEAVTSSQYENKQSKSKQSSLDTGQIYDHETLPYTKETSQSHSATTRRHITGSVPSVLHSSDITTSRANTVYPPYQHLSKSTPSLDVQPTSSHIRYNTKDNTVAYHESTTTALPAAFIDLPIISGLSVAFKISRPKVQNQIPSPPFVFINSEIQRYKEDVPPDKKSPVCTLKKPTEVVFVLQSNGNKRSSCKVLWRFVRHLLRRVTVKRAKLLSVHVMHNCVRLPRPLRHIIRLTGGTIRGIDRMHPSSTNRYLINRMINHLEPFSFITNKIESNNAFLKQLLSHNDKGDKVGIFLTNEVTADFVDSLKTGLKSSLADNINLYAISVNSQYTRRAHARCKQRYRGKIKICLGKLKVVQEKLAKQICSLGRKRS